jgi:hypothetical protein
MLSLENGHCWEALRHFITAPEFARSVPRTEWVECLYHRKGVVTEFMTSLLYTGTHLPDAAASVNSAGYVVQAWATL